MAHRRLCRRSGLPEPKTFETILENAKKLNENKPNAGYMTCAARNAWFLGMTYTGMMHGFGGKWYDNDEPATFGRIYKDKGSGKLLLDSPENVATMTMLRDLAQVWNPASSMPRNSRTRKPSRTTSAISRYMWSGLMPLQNPKENPNTTTKLMSRDFPLGGKNTRCRPHRHEGRLWPGHPQGGERSPSSPSTSRNSRPSKDNAETFIKGGGQPSNVELLNSWGEKPEYQVFKSIALGIANGHHLAQFPEGPQFFQIITQHAGDLSRPERARLRRPVPRHAGGRRRSCSSAPAISDLWSNPGALELGNRQHGPQDRHGPS